MTSNKKGGIEEAAKLLGSLGVAKTERLLELISKKDPRIANEIKEALIDFKEIISITPKMLQDFMSEVNRVELLKALKICDENVQNFFINNTSKSFSISIKESLAQKDTPLSDCEQSYQQVCELLKRMVDEGKIVLGNERNLKLV